MVLKNLFFKKIIYIIFFWTLNFTKKNYQRKKICKKITLFRYKFLYKTIKLWSKKRKWNEMNEMKSNLKINKLRNSSKKNLNKKNIS